MDIREIATWFEVEYWKDMEYPPVEAAMKFSGLDKQQLELAREAINKQVEARGLPPVGSFSVPKVQQRVVDPMFAAYCVHILNTLDKRPIAAKLKELGVSTTKWNALLNNKMNKAYYESRLNAMFKDTEMSAKMGLIRNVESGDLAAIKYFNEVSGVYRPNQEILLNLGVIIGKIMEILASQVDSQVLLQIADSIENLMENETKAIETTGNELLRNAG